MALKWHETAPGLLYEANGESGRRYIVAYDGERWTLDLFLDSEYATEQHGDPQPAPDLNQAQRMAQDWEADLCCG